MNNFTLNSIAIDGTVHRAAAGGAMPNQAAIGSFVINSGAEAGRSATSAPAYVLAKVNIHLAWAIQGFTLATTQHPLAWSLAVDTHFDLNLACAWRQKVTPAKQNRQVTLAGQGMLVAPIIMTGDL